MVGIHSAQTWLCGYLENWVNCPSEAFHADLGSNAEEMSPPELYRSLMLSISESCTKNFKEIKQN